MSGKPKLLILDLALCSFISCETNPVTGREELMLVPEDQDFELGRKYSFIVIGDSSIPNLLANVCLCLLIGNIRRISS